MKTPTAEQTTWASQAFQYTVEFYRESTREGRDNFTPMIDLLEHLEQHPSFQYLSVYKSLYHLTIVSAAHVERPFVLTPNAPCLSVTQLDDEFEFGTFRGGRRKCSFDDAAHVLDNQIVMLAMLCRQFDETNVEPRDQIGR